MAKIAIFHFSPIFHKSEWQSVCYYDGLIKSFLEEGNDVFQFITTDFIPDVWTYENKGTSETHREQIIRELKEFDPDIVISFNNSVVKGIESIVDCPIILWEADSIAYFCEKDTIRKNIGRYHFFAFSEFVEKDFVTQLGAKKSQVSRIKNATAIQRDSNLTKNYNISFIGTCFSLPGTLQGLIHTNREDVFNLINISVGKTYDEVKGYIENSKFIDTNLKPADVLYCRSSQKRLLTLATVAPLGIKIFGDLGWKNTENVSLDLAMNFDERSVYTLAHNQDIYNKSKVCINISHDQAVTGYSWRVLDILGSDSVLVSNHSKDLITDFGDHIPLQLYNSPHEAYDICRKIISDEAMRKDIIEQQQEIINSNYRWVYRFRDIEQILNIPLTNLNREGIYKRFHLNESKEDKMIKAFLSLRSKSSDELDVKNVKKKKPRKSLRYKLYAMLPSFLQRLYRKYKQHSNQDNKRKEYDI